MHHFTLTDCSIVWRRCDPGGYVVTLGLISAIDCIIGLPILFVIRATDSLLGLTICALVVIETIVTFSIDKAYTSQGMFQKTGIH